VVEGLSGRQSTVVAADLAVTLGHPELGVPLKCVTATARLSTRTKLTQHARRAQRTDGERYTPRICFFGRETEKRHGLCCLFRYPSPLDSQRLNFY